MIIVNFDDDDNRSFIDENSLIRHQNILFSSFFIEYINMRTIDLKRKKNRKSNSKLSNAQKIKLKKF